MTIQERRVGPVIILALSGRLVFTDGDALLRERVDDLVSEGHVRLIIDLTDLDYVDSAGIGVLIAKYLSVRRKGGDLRLLRLSSRTHHALEITHLLTIFEAFDTEEAAVASFARTLP
jgi:anti-sigma B factor antagonist